MPALNFKKEFADKVASGEKKQTIRALRKDGRNPRPGQTLYLYTGMRTKSCRRLGEAVCKSVTPITIDSYEINLNCIRLSFADANELISADGIENEESFYDFFRKNHGLPFWGLLIKWEGVRHTNRQAHEEAAGMDLCDEFFTVSGIDPEAMTEHGRSLP